MAQRILPGLVLGLASLPAFAQLPEDPRWRHGQLGLAPLRTPFQVACGTVAFPCDGATALRLYEAPRMARSLDLQLARLDLPRIHRFGPARAEGLDVSLFARAGLAADWGVYGRLGTLAATSPPPGLALQPGEGGLALSYGVGLSWAFSPNASAVLGWDSYDLRLGEPLRSTSLGLRWRY